MLLDSEGPEMPDPKRVRIEKIVGEICDRKVLRICPHEGGCVLHTVNARVVERRQMKRRKQDEDHDQRSVIERENGQRSAHVKPGEVARFFFFTEQDSGDQKTRKGEKDVHAGPKVAEQTYELFRFVGVGLQAPGRPPNKKKKKH